MHQYRKVHRRNAICSKAGNFDSSCVLKSCSIYYPLIVLKIRCIFPRRLSSYIAVRSTLDGTESVVGRTETILDLENPSYSKEIRVEYDVGSDQIQIVAFDIYDGDLLGIGSGFLFATVLVQINFLLRTFKTKIMRGNRILGFLITESRIDQREKTYNLVNGHLHTC